MNAFKTLSGPSAPIIISGVAHYDEKDKKPAKADFDMTNDFPELNLNAKEMVGNFLDYKKAANTKIVNAISDDYVEPGWVKYSVNKNTKKTQVTYGSVEELERPIVDEDDDSKEEMIFNELICALGENWERNRKTFIACHGEEYYNSIYLMEHYCPVMVESDSDTESV